MFFEATLVCPKCANQFCAYIRANYRPTAGERYEVICPFNKSRFQFVIPEAGSPDQTTFPDAIAKDIRQVPEARLVIAARLRRAK